MTRRRERSPAPQPPEQLALSVAGPGETSETAFPVDDLARLVRTMVQGSFPPMWVAGEVSQFTRHRNGHWYFTLKGTQAALRCVIWGSNTWRVPTPPDEGMHVSVLGEFDLFIGRTDLQFVVKRIEAQGDGLWRKAFDDVKSRLAEEGLLDEARRRPLPFFPRCVAVITSQDGAALHDILSVARARNPLVEFVLVPALVQGEECPRSLRTALDRCYRWGGADVIIIGRGGGSREDLWGFNDEKLARKIAESPVPIVSAVGHEIDVTICDLVADFRAPTPSAAAERVVPRLEHMQRETARLALRLEDAATRCVRSGREALARVARRTVLASNALVQRQRLALEVAAGRLHALSPIATLARGYSVTTTADGQVIRSVADVRPGEAIDVHLRDGRLRATVESTTPTDAP